MRLLLRLALRNRKHLSLLVVTLFTLFVLTIASQMEMFALGIMFSSENTEAVLPTGIAKQALSSNSQMNPLNWVLNKTKEVYHFSNNFTAMIFVLLGVAIPNRRRCGLFFYL